jgi:hypothetical protein
VQRNPLHRNLSRRESERRLPFALIRTKEAQMTAKTVALVIGIVLVVVGALGFIPNPLISASGLFAVNTAHNLVHLITGVVLLIGVYTTLGSAMALKIIGVVYAIVAILGFFSGDMLLGFILTNTADTWLHVVLAIVILLAGFMLPDEDGATATA